MRRADIDVAERFVAQLGTIPTDSSMIAVAATPSVNISRMNLIILKSLLDLMHKQGIFITIDRPHQYAEHLLRMNGIDQSKLTYIDMISAFSGDQKGCPKVNAKACAPFSLTDLLELIKLSKVTKESLHVDMLRIEFLIFDNLGSLMVYNSHEAMSRFFQVLIELIRQSEGIFVAFVIDPRNQTDLFKTICKKCDVCFIYDQDLKMLRGAELESMTAKLEVVAHVGSKGGVKE